MRVIVPVLIGWIGLSVVHGVEPPDWWADPIREDFGSYFFTSSGVSRRGFDEALEMAQNHALDQIVERLGPGENLKSHARSRIGGWKLRTREEKRSGSQHHVWIILQYPKEEYQALREYLEGAEGLYETASRMFQAERFEEVVPLTEKLDAAYPMGEQPVFQTEKAKLLAVDALVALGRPEEALRICERVVLASEIEGFRQEAVERRRNIRKNYDDILVRGAFRTKRFAVVSGFDVGEGMRVWGKMGKELSNHVKDFEGVAKNQGGTNARLLEKILEGKADIGAADVPDGYDGLILMGAMGTVHTRENPRKALGGVDYQFAGDIVVCVGKTDGTSHTVKRRWRGGWNPVSLEMCMDVAGLHMLNIWKEEFLEHLTKGEL